MAKVRICPNCGFENEPYETMCVKCLTDLTNAPLVDRSDKSFSEDKTVVQTKTFLVLENKDFVIRLSPEVEHILGRHGEGSQYFSKFPYVSRRHARVFFKEGKWFIEDLNSTNGTYLNHRAIQGIAELTDNSEVSFSSSVSFRVRIEKG